MKIKRRHIAFSVSVALLLTVAAWCWNSLCSTTKIAFLNYQVIELGQIAKANDNSFVKLSEITADDVDELANYDVVLVNGMGLKLTEEQRATLREMSEKVAVFTRMATNPDNNICSIDSIDADFLGQYLSNGSRTNYRNMLGYIRKYVDGKWFKAAEPAMPVVREAGLLSHFDPSDTDGDDVMFNSIGEYNRFLNNNKLYNNGRPNVLLTGMMGNDTEMTKALEAAGMNVYRVQRLQKFVTGGHADSLSIAAVVNMAHGRLGDYMVEYLKQKNIPLFSPININRLTTEWEADKQGMSGGFLSQSIVTPEIDGAVRPWVVFGHEVAKDGLCETVAIESRMKEFTATVSEYVRLQTLPNKDKRIAIVYFKGPGQNSLIATGMEVVPSLYNMLLRLKKEGYNTGVLPASLHEFEQLIMKQGAVFGTYAEGAYGEFIKTQNPALVSKEQYNDWTAKALSENQRREISERYGEFPGKYLATDDGQLAVARLQFGNIIVMPQLMAGEGNDSFMLVHGANTAPPHAYIAPYLYARYGFGAHALVHFGAHGSLEYTPSKQVALGNDDWSDRLIGTLPHYYIYTMDNVGEAMIAKRRTYAQIVSHLTPPFRESELRSIYKQLHDAIALYNASPDAKKADAVKRHTEDLGIASELHLDKKTAYTDDDIQRVERFAEELANEKITGQLYTMGVPYAADDINSTVRAMSVDAIAYGLLTVDKLKGKNTTAAEKHKQTFARLYTAKANSLVTQLIQSNGTPTDAEICRTVGINANELALARRVKAMQDAPDALSMMMQMSEQTVVGKPQKGHGNTTVAQMRKLHKPQDMAGRKVPQMSKGAFEKMEQTGRFPEKMMNAIKKEQKWYKEEQKANRKAAQPAATQRQLSTEELSLANAIIAVEQAMLNVQNYKKALGESAEHEFAAIVNALNGGYTTPSPGGDPITNPQALPTGRNLFSINVENTPSADAWEKAKSLCNNTIDMYRKSHGGEYPRKVSYTLWSSEFIETHGATIAQALYMLGIEPVRDAFGRVQDIRLIPSAELGRPRIDVVVQTSGQLRDLAASRLALIQRAVAMAAEADDKEHENLVREGVTESERLLVERGMTPKEAREVSRYRVFGGVGGNYGTGIQGMVLAGDKWDKEEQIAEVYLNNMGAFYGDSDNWEQVRKHAFEAALTRTDVVVQPRQSNTWGALSLDHVYEFMGGANLAIRNVTGKEPDAYLADYRNHQNMRMQEVKEAIGVESRTTILNPSYIKEKMKGGASSGNTFAEVVTNTYAWNVMKPEAIDNRLWNEIYNVYVTDKHKLGVKTYFDKTNPAALEEMTAVMLETIRKGMWKASPEQVKEIANLHVEMVNKHLPSCSGFVCDNAKLRQFIVENTDNASAQQYMNNVAKIRNEQSANDSKGMVMKKEQVSSDADKTKAVISSVLIVTIIVAAFSAMAWLVRRRRKQNEE